jgi:hypothetical protein
MTFPYLDRPLLPLAVALPRILAQVEAALDAARPTEKLRLQLRAERRNRVLPTGIRS